MKDVVKAILSIIDPNEKIFSLKPVFDSYGNALAAASVEKDSVGLAKDSTLTTLSNKVATEATLSGVKTQTDKLSFDTANNLKTTDKNMDVPLSGVRSDLSSYFNYDPSSNIPLSFKNFYLKASDVIVPSSEVWYVSSGNVLANRSLTVNGYLRNDGIISVMTEISVDGGELDNRGEIEAGW
jgi:hypothetical protein